jgi:hypothetical protein
MGSGKNITGADRAAPLCLWLLAGLSLRALERAAALAAHSLCPSLRCHVASGHGHLLLCLRQGHRTSSVRHRWLAKRSDTLICVPVCVAVFARRAHQCNQGSGCRLRFLRRAAYRASLVGLRPDRYGWRRLHDRRLSQRWVLLRLCPQVYQSAKSASGSYCSWPQI